MQIIHVIATGKTSVLSSVAISAILKQPKMWENVARTTSLNSDDR
jgi:methyl coenzyme M reductase beta subunit